MKRYTREEKRFRSKRLLMAITYFCFAALVFFIIVSYLSTPVKSTDMEKNIEVESMSSEITEQEDFENEKIEAALLDRAEKIENVTITHYCICEKCCGKTDGITASGVKATPGVTVAVDPDIIPLGADVLVDYGDGDIKYYRADDTGGSIKGNHIDLCVGSHEEAISLGVRTATVWWVDHGNG